MFGTLGGPELFLVFVIALIVFGPRKLPEIGKSLGKMIGEFRRASNDLKRTIEDEVEADKLRELTRVNYSDATAPPPDTRPSSPPAAAPPETPASPASGEGAQETQDAPEAKAPTPDPSKAS